MANPEGCNQFKSCGSTGKTRPSVRDPFYSGKQIHKRASSTMRAFGTSSHEAHAEAKRDLKSIYRKTTSKIDSAMHAMNRGLSTPKQAATRIIRLTKTGHRGLFGK